MGAHPPHLEGDIVTCPQSIKKELLNLT